MKLHGRVEAIKEGGPWRFMSRPSYQELADQFAVPLNTMRTWPRRSLLRLRVHGPMSSPDQSKETAPATKCSQASMSSRPFFGGQAEGRAADAQRPAVCSDRQPLGTEPSTFNDEAGSFDAVSVGLSERRAPHIRRCRFGEGLLRPTLGSLLLWRSVAIAFAGHAAGHGDERQHLPCRRATSRS